MTLVALQAGRVFARAGRPAGWTELVWVYDDVTLRVERFEARATEGVPLSDRSFGVRLSRVDRRTIATRWVSPGEGVSIDLSRARLRVIEVVEGADRWHEVLGARLDLLSVVPGVRRAAEWRHGDRGHER